MHNIKRKWDSVKGAKRPGMEVAFSFGKPYHNENRVLHGPKCPRSRAMREDRRELGRNKYG